MVSRNKTKWRDIINTRMIELGMTQADLANELTRVKGKKVGRSTIGHWMTGAREPRNIEDFEDLAKAVHLDPSKLLSPSRQKEMQDILSKEELTLLTDYRKLTPKDKITVKRMIEALPKHRS